MIYTLRRELDHALLEEFFYLAVYCPPGNPPYPRSIVELPELLKYHKDFGRPGDLAVTAEDTVTTGIAWLRLFPENDPGYGFVAGDIPELGVSVLPARRGEGIGGELVRLLEQAAFADGVRAISLSVNTDNPAMRLYARIGYEVVRVDGDSSVMVKRLK